MAVGDLKYNLESDMRFFIEHIGYGTKKYGMKNVYNTRQHSFTHQAIQFFYPVN